MTSDKEKQVQHARQQPKAARKYVGVRFNCCGIYTRIYVNKEGTAYEGKCPKCFKPVRLKIGTGGTSARIFEAY
jgi:hypothetical protein